MLCDNVQIIKKCSVCDGYGDVPSLEPGEELVDQKGPACKGTGVDPRSIKKAEKES